MKYIIDIPEIPKNDKQRWVVANGTPYEERPHGEWVWKAYDPDYDCGDIVCSKCSVVVYEGVPQARLKVVKWPFCPDCGTDMRKEGENN